MASELYKRDTYLNKDIPYLFNTCIYEYDMHRAGISITKEFELLPDKEIARIERRSKNKKDIAVLLGMIQKKDQVFKKALSDGFVEIRKRFFEKNGIETNELLSVKKDAIFVLRPCDVCNFGEVDFALKHTYTSYVYTGKYEFYYSETDGVDVKGIDDVKLYPHRDYMLDFIRHFFYKVEMESKEDVLRFLRVFGDRYKKRELDCGYYRSFDRNGNYVTTDGMTYTDIGISLLPDISLDTNYFDVIIPLIQTQLT